MFDLEFLFFKASDTDTRTAERHLDERAFIAAEGGTELQEDTSANSIADAPVMVMKLGKKCYDEMSQKKKKKSLKTFLKRVFLNLRKLRTTHSE